MTRILALCLLCSLTAAQSTFSFDVNNLRDIWNSPKLKASLKDRFPNHDFDQMEASERIVGGSVARLGQFPHYVMLITDDIYLCGGSIIQTNWVMTVSVL